MTLEDQLKLNADLLSQQVGSVDALMATMTAMLRVLKDDPAIARAIAQNLERHHAIHLAASETSAYAQGFGMFRDLVMAQLKQSSY